MKNNEIEISFGAKDSELIESTYHIPYGMEAIIEGDKVIIRKKESDAERIRKDIVSFLRSKNGYMTPNEDWDFHNRWLPWLEKQSKENMIEALRLEYEKGKADGLQEQRKEWNEEDERILEQIKFAVLNLSSYREDTRQECIDWLKSLKERIQSKQEWSKEDEKEWKSIVSVLTRMHFLDELNFLRRKLNK